MINGALVVDVAKRAAARWPLSLAARQDAEQDAAIAYITAARILGVDELPLSYAVVRCRGSIVDSLRRATQYNRRTRATPLVIYPSGDEWDAVLGHGENPADVIANDQWRAHLVAALRASIDKLSDDDRKLLREHYWRGGRVDAWRLAVALNRLRAILGGEHAEVVAQVQNVGI